MGTFKWLGVTSNHGNMDWYERVHDVLFLSSSDFISEAEYKTALVYGEATD